MLNYPVIRQSDYRTGKFKIALLIIQRKWHIKATGIDILAAILTGIMDFFNLCILRFVWNVYTLIGSLIISKICY